MRPRSGEAPGPGRARCGQGPGAARLVQHQALAADHDGEHRVGSSGGRPALYEAANARVDALVDALAGLDPHAAPEELRRRAVVAWSLAHGAVQIAIDVLLQSLDVGLDVDALAERVGQATLAMARPGAGHPAPR